MVNGAFREACPDEAPYDYVLGVRGHDAARDRADDVEAEVADHEGAYDVEQLSSGDALHDAADPCLSD